MKFHKRRDFFISYDNQVLLGVLSWCSPPSRISQKSPSFPLQFGKKRTYLETQLKEELTELFWKLPGCSLFPGVRIGWSTLLIYPLPPKIASRVKCFSSCQKVLPSPFSLARNRSYLGTHLKGELANLIGKLRGYSLAYSHTGRVDSNVNTLLIWLTL